MLRPRSETLHVFGNASTAVIPVVAAMTNPNRTVAVYQMLITASAATNVTVQDSSGAALSETFPLAANKALILDQLNDTDPWFITASGLGVQLAQSGTANIGFDCWYQGGPFYTAPPAGGHVLVLTPTTWNPSDQQHTTLSNNNLTATSTTSGQYVRAVDPGVTGSKYYFELTSTVWPGAGYVGVGLATSSATLTSAPGVGTTTLTAAGNINVNGGGTVASIAGLSAGNTVGIATDLSSNNVWFRLAPSGNWNGSGTANPAANTGGVSISVLTLPLYPYFATNNTANNMTANFGASAFSGAVPAGFTAGWGPVQ